MLERLRHQLNTSWFKALAGIALVSTVAYAAQNFNSINVNGNITVTGSVDGRDVSADGSVIDAITANGVTALTSAEVDQLENINATVISSSTWGFLGGVNQALSSTSSPTFVSVTGTLATAAQPNVTSTGTLTAFSLDSFFDVLQQATPANPAASRNRLYFKSDNKLYRLTSAGVETEVGGAGANTALSNLTATAVNESLISDTNDTDDLGSAAILWNDTYTHHLRAGAGGPRINLVSGEMYDSSNVLSADFSSRELVGGGSTKISWSSNQLTLTSLGGDDIELIAGGNIDANTNLVTNVIDPVSAQDAATKNYVDTRSAGTNEQREYIANGKFEVNTTGWTTYDDASAVPVDCSSGTVTTTFTRTTTAGEVLRDTASGELSKDAANRQGEGVAYDFTLDYGDYSAFRPVPISFDYKSTANYASSDILIYVYDVDAAGTPQAIQTVQSLTAGTVMSSTGGTRWSGVFYPTTSTSDNYRLCVHIATANATAYDFILDSVHIGNQNTTPVPILGEWVTFTPTGTWSTNTTYTGRWRRVGDSMEMQVTATLAGAPTAADLSINIPFGYAIETAKTATTTANRGSYGVVSIDDSGTRRYVGGVIYASSTSVALSHAETGNQGIINATNPITFGASDSVSILFKVPIAGWASSASLSANENLVSGARARYTGTAQSIPVAAATILNAATKTFDSHSAVTTGASWKFTAPARGRYKVTASTQYVARTYAVGNLILTQLYKNGGFVSQGGTSAAHTTSSVVRASDFQDTIELNVGDYIDVRAYNEGSVSTNTDGFYIVVEQEPDFSIFSIYGDRVNVGARAYNSATSVSGSLATVVWTTEEYDSNNALASGVYTCPITGKYQVNSAVALSGTFILNNTTVIEIQKNGTAVSNNTHYIAAAITNEHVQLSDVINCTSGDTLRIQVSNSGTAPAIVSSNTRNFLSISYMGN